MEWRFPASSRRKKVRAEKPRIKTMLITFFDGQVIIHKEFLPDGMTMNAARYIESLIRFILGKLQFQYARFLLLFTMLTPAEPISSNSS
ncbi:hypothetical protein TNCV_3757141 [Trichonephila clavipes]|nr:hypothetical protein TNCV_3757141 [Trichonephila clavipes]